MSAMDLRCAPFALVLALSAGLASAPAQLMKLTEPQEIEVGRRAAAELTIDQPMVTDEKINIFVQKIGLRLARESDRPGLRFHFGIIDSDDINAFALPGGFVYVTRGLISAVDDKSELAGALAHEIGHIAARQHAGKIRRSQLATLGVSFLGPVAGGGVRATAALRGGRSGARGLFMRFTREDEREADRIAAKMLLDAGYEQEAMLRLLQRITSMSEDDPRLAKRYFSSHATLEDRVDNIADLLASFPPRTESPRGAAELVRIKERLRSIQPPGALTTSDATAAVLEASEQEPESRAAKEREVAALFAPVFYQGIGNEPRYDYITSFDFDGDLRGDNNWVNAGNPQHALKAWIYYAVRETRTHFFLHYAAFHPRDYKGGSKRGTVFSRMLRKASKPAAAVDPTGRVMEAVLAHENDLEGCLVVVEKRGDDPRDAKVVFLQTLAHNNFLKYAPQSEPREGFMPFLLHGRRPLLYVEPEGHGIEACAPASDQVKNRLRIFTFTGQAEEPGDDQSQPVGYNLTPISTTLWPEARRGLTATYGDTEDYGIFLLTMEAEAGPREEAWPAGRIGSAFRGTVGGVNMARPPWGWFDAADKGQLLGEWFFDPARVIRRDYGLGEELSIAYLNPWPPADPEPTGADGAEAAPSGERQ